MTLDKEFEVAVEAVRLVISILRYHRDMLTDKVPYLTKYEFSCQSYDGNLRRCCKNSTINT
jgi:hypothetical protein